MIEVVKIRTFFQTSQNGGSQGNEPVKLIVQ